MEARSPPAKLSASSSTGSQARKPREKLVILADRSLPSAVPTRPMPKQLINNKEDVVLEAIQGTCSTSSHLNYLDGFPHIKVVQHQAASKLGQVAVVSGGGAGHEPAHIGYVGEGMLSAVAIGDVFASPPAEAVLAAIQAVTGKHGCLLIVKNYTGDRLNFGLAAEQAKGLGLSVEMVVVGDDCALPGSGVAGRRGIAGTVFVHKIAGAAASQGLRLAEVKKEAESAAAAVGSMGIATQSCTLPGGQASSRLGDQEIEMGLGIHGEPGATKQQMTRVDDIVAKVVETIVKEKKLSGSGEELALLVNNLGSASCLEMGIVANAAVKLITGKHGLKLARSYVGTFMTSLDMPGFSLSLLPLSGRRKQLLDQPTEATAWIGKSSSFISGKSPIPLPQTTRAPDFSRPTKLSDFGKSAERSVESGAGALIEAAPMLDEWDRRVGDGDCGSTMARGGAAVQAALRDRMPLNDAALLLQCLADCSRTMGGSSGALYNIFFTAAAAHVPANGAAGLSAAAKAFEAGVEAIEHYGGARKGSRTMLDALLPASAALRDAAARGKSGREAARAAAEAAAQGAEQTMSMTAAAGRSSYVPENETKGIPDPGAKAVAIWLQAAADVFM